MGKVPTITIDKTDGAQVYLGKNALDVELVSSKTSELNISVPDATGDYVSHNQLFSWLTIINLIIII